MKVLSFVVLRFKSDSPTAGTSFPSVPSDWQMNNENYSKGIAHGIDHFDMKMKGGTESTLNYLTILIDFLGAIYSSVTKLDFTNPCPFFIFFFFSWIRELQRLFLDPRNPQYHFTLTWLLSSPCPSLFPISSSEILLPSFPGLGRNLISSDIPEECCPLAMDNPFTFPACSSIPFSPWLLAWHSHANGFGFWTPLGHSSFSSNFLLPSLIKLGMCLP